MRGRVVEGHRDDLGQPARKLVRGVGEVDAVVEEELGRLGEEACARAVREKWRRIAAKNCGELRASGFAIASVASRWVRKSRASSNSYGNAWFCSETPTTGTPASIAAASSRRHHGRVSTDCDCRARRLESRTWSRRSPDRAGRRSRGDALAQLLLERALEEARLHRRLRLHVSTNAPNLRWPPATRRPSGRRRRPSAAATASAAAAARPAHSPRRAPPSAPASAAGRRIAAAAARRSGSRMARRRVAAASARAAAAASAGSAAAAAARAGRPRRDGEQPTERGCRRAAKLLHSGTGIWRTVWYQCAAASETRTSSRTAL